MFLWFGFVVAVTTLHVALQRNLVTVKGLLVMMVPSIPWHLLIGSWAEYVSFGHDGGRPIFLNSFIQLRGTRNG